MTIKSSHHLKILRLSRGTSLDTFPLRNELFNDDGGPVFIEFLNFALTESVIPRLVEGSSYNRGRETIGSLRLFHWEVKPIKGKQRVQELLLLSCPKIFQITEGIDYQAEMLRTWQGIKADLIEAATAISAFRASFDKAKNHKLEQRKLRDLVRSIQGQYLRDTCIPLRSLMPLRYSLPRLNAAGMLFYSLFLFLDMNEKNIVVRCEWDRCGKWFTTNYARSRFCCDDHRTKWNNQARRSRKYEGEY